MEISEQRQGDITILSPTGRINNDTSPAFQTKLLGCVGSAAAKVLIDFSDVEYISSAGLRALMMASKQSKAANGRLAVAASHRWLRKFSRLAASRSWCRSLRRPLRLSRP